MSKYTPEQKKAYAIKMAKQRSANKSVIVVQAPAVPKKRYKKRYNSSGQITGHGDYKKTLGYHIGSSIGGALGYGAQHLIKTITGFGDYHIIANSLMGGVYDPPALKNLRDRGVVIRHREYITDIVASSAFTINSYSINPGLPSSFPWLAQVAEAFEEYYITGMIYEYKTLSADYTTASSAALGFICMATQYNVLNPVFPDKKTMENYEFANSGKPSESFIHPIECKKSVTPVSELYVRTGNIPANADQRLYDLGSFQIATGGNSGTGILGELWVTFEIVLCKPKLIEAIGYDVLTDHFQLNNSNITNSNPLSTSPTLVEGSAIGGAINATGTTYTFPSTISNGSFLFNYQVTGASTACTVPVVTVSNAVILQVWRYDMQPSVSNTGTTCPTFIHDFVIKVTASPCVVTWSTTGVLPTSPLSGDLWVTQVNQNVITV